MSDLVLCAITVVAAFGWGIEVGTRSTERRWTAAVDRAEYERDEARRRAALASTPTPTPPTPHTEGTR